MEFDNNNTPTPQDNDEARKLAEAKRVTVQPLHNDVTPEPDAAEVTREANGPAAPNTPNETEQTKPVIEPSREILNQPGPQQQPTPTPEQPQSPQPPLPQTPQPNNHRLAIVAAVVIVICIIVVVAAIMMM